MNRFSLPLLALLLVGGANAADPLERVKQTLSLAEVKLEIYWLDNSSEVVRIAAEHGRILSTSRTRTAASIGGHTQQQGFAVLGKLRGETICRIYALKPISVDDSRTLSLGHELAHCLLGAYH